MIRLFFTMLGIVCAFALVVYLIGWGIELAAESGYGRPIGMAVGALLVAGVFTIQAALSGARAGNS